MEQGQQAATEPSPASGGPRTSRGQATAARLRAAARQVFGELGYAAARVEDITAAAGVSHGTFYTYHENKAAVLDALLDETAAALRAVTEEPWDGPDPRGVVQGVIERFVDVFVGEADVIRTWLEAASHEAHFLDRLRDVRAEYVDRVAGQLAPALRGTGHDPTIAAGALVAMVEGYATQRVDVADDGARDAAVTTLAELWFGGIARLTLRPAGID
ncbi:MAG: TetR/AcrR family transcriptional regulator [Actinomycetes bacterium]